VSWYERKSPADWGDAILAQSDPMPRANELFLAYVNGELDAYSPLRNLRDWDRWLGAMFTKLRPLLPRRLDSVCQNADEDRKMRRWCWAQSYYLSSQDEDLLLMSDATSVILLDEVAKQCTKAGYAMSIVTHHVRDSLHHALWVHGDAVPGGPETHQKVADRLQFATSILPAVVATGDEAAIAYVDRVAGYRHPASLDEASMKQRILDLRRCAPKPENEPRVSREGSSWRGDLKLAGSTHGTLFVDPTTARMWAATKKQLQSN
jgi:hypothetical protein